jgi:hypothetical protein
MAGIPTLAKGKRAKLTHDRSAVAYVGAGMLTVDDVRANLGLPPVSNARRQDAESKGAACSS